MEKECCPKFDPAPWDGKVFSWSAKKFVKGKVFCLFYMPLTFGQEITKIMKKLDEAGTKCQDWLCLSDHTSMFNMDMYLAVDKEVTGLENVEMSGKYFSKVYEGQFGDTGKWCKDFEKVVKEKGYLMQKMYMWYTTCPKCAKKWGKNYVVIVAKIG